MKIKLSLLLFFCLATGFSQKETAASFDAKGIEKLYILTDEVFKIKIKTSKIDKINITSKAHGEYYDEISLNTEVLQDRLVITSQFNERLQNGFDKLSAHKVFSFEINLEIPENLQVFIKSNIASLQGQGKYKYLEAELKSGFCSLEDFEGNALVNTYSGSIEMETSHAKIDVSSRSGSIKLEKITPGNNKVELHSITGDIRVQKN
jgi:DUF4097 and DUF4098 domain-containing protein YvlB